MSSSSKSAALSPLEQVLAKAQTPQASNAASTVASVLAPGKASPAPAPGKAAAAQTPAAAATPAQAAPLASGSTEPRRVETAAPAADEKSRDKAVGAAVVATPPIAAASDRSPEARGAAIRPADHDDDDDDHDDHDDDHPSHGQPLLIESPTAIPALKPGAPRQSGVADGPATAAASASPAFSTLSLADTFLLHSRPTASKVIYLDFDGHYAASSRWQNGGALQLGPYYSVIDDAVKLEIQAIWATIAEDYHPFDVNVTTQDPGLDALIYSGTGDTTWGTRAVFTSNINLLTGSKPLNTSDGVGGQAYLNSFWNGSDDPALIFNKGAYAAAATGAHEVGHTLGLSHDGNTSTQYYPGHGSGATSWGALMGSSFLGTKENVTTWSKGEYYGASNIEDDLKIITTYNGFDYRIDDHGGTLATATALQGTEFQSIGSIERNDDQDVFSFLTGAGAVSLKITNAVLAWVSDGNASGQTYRDELLPTQLPNLDISATLYDANGGVVATSNPLDALGASFDLTLAAGRYYVAIDGVGAGNPFSTTPSGYTDYASLGQYVISGAVQDPSGLVIAPVGPLRTSESGGSVSLQVSLDSAPQSTVTVAVSSENPAEGQPNLSSLVFTPQNWNTPQALQVAGQDDALEDGRVAYNIVFDTSGSADPEFAALPARRLEISNDDNDGPDVSFSGPIAAALEGVDGTLDFTVSLSRTSSVSVEVGLTTVDGTAKSGSDFQAFNQTISFAPGETSKTVGIALVNDTAAEDDESFDLKITSVLNGNLIGPDQRTASITDTVSTTTTTTLVAGVDVLRLDGSNAIDGFGNATANLIVGNSAANRLKGLGGGDQLIGNGGIDLFDLSGIISAADAVTVPDYQLSEKILLGDAQTSRLGTTTVAIRSITNLLTSKHVLETGTGQTVNNKTSVGFDLFLVNTPITEADVDLASARDGSELLDALSASTGVAKLTTTTAGGKGLIGAYDNNSFYLFSFNAGSGNKTLVSSEIQLIGTISSSSPLTPGLLTASNFGWA